MRDLDIQLGTIRQAKEQGRTRYVGVTATFERQYQQLEELIRNEELDFVQLKYTLGERRAAERLLPLARDRGIAVAVNEPFSAGRLFRATSGLGLPDWAADFDCRTWSQFFLKYILANPAVTVVIPSTVDPEHLVENMGAGVGRLPDERTRRRMEDLLDAVA